MALIELEPPSTRPRGRDSDAKFAGYWLAYANFLAGSAGEARSLLLALVERCRRPDARLWHRVQGNAHLEIQAVRALHPEKREFVDVGLPFGPKPRHYTFKINRKARQRALRAAFSVHAERGSVAVLAADAFEQPSTRRWLVGELLAGSAWTGTLVYSGALFSESYGISSTLVQPAVDSPARCPASTIAASIGLTMPVSNAAFR